MPVQNQDRPLDVVREEVIDQLIFNYGHATLSAEAFERRLDQALASGTVAELDTLVADLELQSDPSYVQQKREELDADLDYNYGSPDEVEYSINVFGGNSRSGHWQVPREIRMLNVFGGGEIDFTDAKFSHPVVRIRTFTLFGGASIYVREDLNTTSKIVSIFGGSNNEAPSNKSSQAPLVIVEGIVIFGGVSIEVKRTIKEMFLDFANRFRGLRKPSHSRDSHSRAQVHSVSEPHPDSVDRQPSAQAQR